MWFWGIITVCAVMVLGLTVLAMVFASDPEGRGARAAITCGAAAALVSIGSLILVGNKLWSMFAR